MNKRTKNHSNTYTWISITSIIITLWSGSVTGLTAQSKEITNIRAVFRGGQTFITWKETGQADARYKIYRHSKAISSTSELEKATLIGEVGDYSSMNASASYSWSAIKKNKDREKLYKSQNPVYFVIEEGKAPLSDDTGLFVHTANEEMNAYYAVTSEINGKEIKNINNGKNATRQAVKERVIAPNPVLQKNNKQYLDFVHWISDVDTPGYKAMGRSPGVAYTFRVTLPKSIPMRDGLPLSVLLHGSGMQYNGKASRIGEKDSLSLRLDSPVIRGKLQGGLEKQYQDWGWHASFDRETRSAKPLPMNRVIWTINWVEQKFKTNPEKVSLRGSSMGGIGTLSVGLLNPERFSVIHAMIPPLPSGARSSMFGFSPAKYIADNPQINFPFIMMTAGRTDTTVKFKGKPEFAKMLQKNKRGFIFYWDLRPHTGAFKGKLPKGLELPPIYWGRNGGKPTMPTAVFSRNQSFPAIANLSINDDPGTVEFAVKESKRPAWDAEGAGDLIGTINGAAKWDMKTIVDTENQYEITLSLDDDITAEQATADISFRRLQEFMVEPENKVRFLITSLKTKRELQKGEITCDEHGVITIADATILKSGSRIKIMK